MADRAAAEEFAKYDLGRIDPKPASSMTSWALSVSAKKKRLSIHGIQSVLN